MNLTTTIIDHIKTLNTVTEVVEYLEFLSTVPNPSFKTHRPFQGENGDWYAIPNEQFEFEVLRHGLAPDHETKLNIESTWQKLECFDRFNNDQ